MANSYPEDRSYRAWHQQQMQDPDYARAFDAQGPEFDAILKLIALRHEKGLSQTELAEKAGTTQPSTARLESRKKTRNLNLLERMADVLGHKITVGVEPGNASPLNGAVAAKKAAPKKAAATTAVPRKAAPRKRAIGAKKAPAARRTAKLASGHSAQSRKKRPTTRVK
jgi:transcriptional regulator with XRE-family HTH domain